MNLSLEAKYAFIAIKNGLNPSYRDLMTGLEIGQRPAVRILKELRDAGLLELKTMRINNRLIKGNYVTDLGEDTFPQIANPRYVDSVCVQSVRNDSLTMQNSNNSIIANSAKELSEKISDENFQTVNLEVKDMSWDGLFKNTQSSETNEDYREKRKKKSVNRRAVRLAKPHEKWSPSDICYEFAERLSGHIHIEPWQVTQSEFIVSMGNLRKRQQTNGVDELAVMDLFFAQLEIQNYSNPDMLWRMFVKRFPGLLPTARLAMPDPQAEAEADALLEKELKRIREKNANV